MILDTQMRRLTEAALCSPSLPPSFLRRLCRVDHPPNSTPRALLLLLYLGCTTSDGLDSCCTEGFLLYYHYHPHPLPALPSVFTRPRPRPRYPILICTISALPSTPCSHPHIYHRAASVILCNTIIQYHTNSIDRRFLRYPIFIFLPIFRPRGGERWENKLLHRVLHLPRGLRRTKAE